MAGIRSSQRRKRMRGTTLVEAAIVLQILVLITLGAIEYGWLFLTLERITNAARHGARIEAAKGVPDTAGDDAIASLFAGDPAFLSKLHYEVTNDGTYVTATVSVNTADVRLLNIKLLPAPPTLMAVVKMAKERG
jgi:Flp pilus assembly protein TadG